MQGEVERDGASGLFGDVVGEGFAVVCAAGDPHELLGPQAAAFLADLGAHVVTLDPGVPGRARDATGALSGWMAEHDLAVAITRPDGYAFGGAATIAGLAVLVDELQQALAAPAGAAAR